MTTLNPTVNNYKDFIPFILTTFASVFVFITGLAWSDAVKKAILHSNSERIKAQGPWIFAGIVTLILIIFSVLIAVLIWINNNYLPEPENGNCINVCSSSSSS